MFTQSWEKLPASSGAAQVKGSQVLIGWKHRKATVGDDVNFFHLNIPGMFETKPQQKKPHLHLFAEHKKNTNILQTNYQALVKKSQNKTFKLKVFVSIFVQRWRFWIFCQGFFPKLLSTFSSILMPNMAPTFLPNSSTQQAFSPRKKTWVNLIARLPASNLQNGGPPLGW